MATSHPTPDTAPVSRASGLPAATVSAFRWVPDFARGLVRDLRVRWALEEIGRPYRTTLLAADRPRDEDYRRWQPFGQVPAFDDGEHRLFESGAILLYLGDQDEHLLPRDSAGRWRATTWLIAALNSVEPPISMLANYDIFNADKPWAAAARPTAVELVEKRLASLSAALGEMDWLAQRFTVADIAMVTVLRNLRLTDIVAGFPNLAAYVERGQARPAFARALAAQSGDFDDVGMQRAEA
jgi:glutathione S-transferase